MKKAFNLVANIGAIVLISILLLGLLGSCMMLSDIASPGDLDASVFYLVIVFLILLCTATIVLAALALAKCNNGKARGLQIAVTVLVCIVAILAFLGSSSGNAAVIVYGVLCLVVVGFEIAAMCVKSAQKEAPQPNTDASAAQKQYTVDEKIAELKHLKELNAITEEQYETAINSIINEVK